MPRIILAAAAALLMVGGGCQWKGGASTRPADETADAWRPEPVRMRLYPSSRLVNDPSSPLLEARIELLDQMGDSIKGVGDFHFELVTSSQSSEWPTTERLSSWDVALTTLSQQKQFYDPVTRAYLFRLKVDSAVAARRGVILKVLLSTPEGRRITLEAPINAGG